jgi:hypothetical protein
MRSSKSRSRSKSNRNRSVGNVINRVFDSSGPEGKVRGTPQQIIDKYNQLARDAQLSNDRVAFENFQQHAEHYTRMLAEAQREQDARREQDQQHRDRQSRRDDDDQPSEATREERPAMNGHDTQDEQRPRDQGGERRGKEQAAEARPEPTEAPGDVIDTGSGGDDSTLVETPESRPSRPRRKRRTKGEEGPQEDKSANDETEAAE